MPLGSDWFAGKPNLSSFHQGNYRIINRVVEQIRVDDADMVSHSRDIY
jgi:hypothetical protein